MIITNKRVYIGDFIDKKDWRFYVAIVIGVTLAGTGTAFLVSRNINKPHTRDLKYCNYFNHNNKYDFISNIFS